MRHSHFHCVDRATTHPLQILPHPPSPLLFSSRYTGRYSLRTLQNMGGKALKTVQTNRLSKSELSSLQSRLLPIISLHFHKYAVPPYLPTKQSFGDLDILVAGPKSSLAIASIISHFRSKESVTHGAVTSFEVDGFQVDLISVPEREYEVALGCLSWGDLGAMIGLVAKNLGVKYGSRGLSVAVTMEDVNEVLDGRSEAFDPQSLSSNHDSTTLSNIQLSLSHDDILSHLGFDPSTHSKGFSTQQDLFTYLTTSFYFLPNLFVPSSTQTTSQFRRRIQDRPIWTDLASFIQLTNPAPGPGMTPDLLSDDPEIRRKMRREFKKRSVELFGKKEEWDFVIERERLRRVVKSRIGGDLVRNVTGREGKELGLILKKIKDELGADQMEVWKRVEGMTDVEVHDLIIKCADRLAISE